VNTIQAIDKILHNGNIMTKGMLVNIENREGGYAGNNILPNQRLSNKPILL
jgi:hypothetical protein